MPVDDDLVHAFEERTRQHPDRVVRLRGQVDDEPFELLIFRGFSSSTTHPTSFDPDASVLPDKVVFLLNHFCPVMTSSSLQATTIAFSLLVRVK